MLEAARRLKQKAPVVQTLPPPGYPEAEFLFHLCRGDSMMATIDGKDELFIFNTMATSTLQTWFACHYDATDGHRHPLTGVSTLRSSKPGSFSAKFPSARKVTLSLLGE